MEKAPHKKEDLTIANHVLKLASKLLKVALFNYRLLHLLPKAELFWKVIMLVRKVDMSRMIQEVCWGLFQPVFDVFTLEY